ncbi:hypothetical protein AMECASPLE_012912 [Ameca splendens]|uniref:Uncharacterized protein n=1 Tax=Ameca splendens TaxID=208324 RepID=A0ABV0XEA0_9TELE
MENTWMVYGDQLENHGRTVQNSRCETTEEHLDYSLENTLRAGGSDSDLTSMVVTDLWTRRLTRSELNSVQEPLDFVLFKRFCSVS